MCIVDHKVRQKKRKDWSSRFLISLNIVRKQTLLPNTRCPEKSLNVTNCTRILQIRSEGLTDLKTIRNWKSRTFCAAFATSRSEFFTGKCFNREMFYEETYLLFIMKTYQLTYCQKFSNLTTRAAHSSEYDRTGGQLLPGIIIRNA